MAGEVVNGTDVLVFMSSYTPGGSPSWGVAAHATSHTLNKQMAVRNTSNKGTGSYETSAAGRRTVDGTMEGMYIDSDTYNYEDFSEAWAADTPMLMIFGKESGTSGNPDTTTGGGVHWYESGLFLITGISATFPDAQNSTYTVSFKLYSDYKQCDLLT